MNRDLLSVEDINNMYEKKVITPHLLINTPFLEYCDGNRLQIAASQARQAIPLERSEPAYVITGYEREDSIPDKVLAKGYGKVEFVSSKAIVIHYPNQDEYDVIPVYPDDHILVEEGQYIFEGDTIKVKEFFFSPLGELTQGVNLVCAIISHPLGYEDAFVVSEQAKRKLTGFIYHKEEIILENNDILLSRNDSNYRPLPEEGETIKVDEPIYVKTTSKFLDWIKPEYKYPQNPSLVKQVYVVINKDYEATVREMHLFLKYYQRETRERILSTELPKSVKDQLINMHLAFDQNIKIDGINSNQAYIKINLRERVTLSDGDKITNRHAAKGVLSRIVSDDIMPITSDNRRAEIILNPMAIPSRMNESQLFELAANRALYNFTLKIKEMVKNGSSTDEIYEFVLQFYKLMSENCKDDWIYKGIKNKLDEVKDILEPEDFLDFDWRFIAPAFESVSARTLEKMLEMVSKPLYVIEGFHTIIKDNDKCYIIDEDIQVDNSVKERILEIYGRFYDKDDVLEALKTHKVHRITPFVDVIYFNNKFMLASVDYMYFYRLVHLSSKKYTARSISTYDMFGQPAATSSSARRTPHRFGEMEVWTLIAYDALRILEEILNDKSDNFTRKLEYVYQILTGQKVSFGNDKLSNEALKFLKVLLYQLGIELDNKQDVFNIDYYIKKIKEKLESI